MTEPMDLTFTLNGSPTTVRVHPMARLLDVLRDDLRLTGTKEGCGEGECGACAVLLNGRVVNSCLVPALQAEGSVLVTIEGLAAAEGLHPAQAALLAHNGAQCGFCSPGMAISAADLLRRCPHPEPGQIKDALSGNLCRCTGYTKIIDAVTAASQEVQP